MAPFDRLQFSYPSSSSMSSLEDSKTKSAPSPLHLSLEESSHPLPPSPREYLSRSPTKQLTTSNDDSHDSLMASAPLRIFAAVASLFGMPILLFRCFPASSVSGNLAVIGDTWDSLLHFSCVYLGALCLLVAMYFGPCCLDRCSCACDHGMDSKMGCGGDDRWSRCLSRCTDRTVAQSQTSLRKFRAFIATVDGLALAVAVAVMIPLTSIGSFPMIIPSWGWYPFAWFDYHIYRSSDLAPALQGLCLDQPAHEIRLPRKSWMPTIFHQDPSPEHLQSHPLCLSEKSWDTLSAGALSSQNPQDVKTVLKGIDYVRNTSGGITIAILARDIKDSLEALKQNVESMKHFIPKLSVVIFENDSKDGSREAIKEWAKVANGYDVDLMECEEAADCKLGKKHRDTGGKGYSKTSAVGDMDVYRQRVTDYITGSPIYREYSHMMVIDIDLAVSLSPLGMIHSFGEHPENAVASSGRQLFPFGMGTLIPPYDMSAFKPWATNENFSVLNLHENWWCAMMPAGSRWRNSCDASSPFLMMELLRLDRGHEDTTGLLDDTADFYRVESAFNGAVLYPLDQVRETQATYDHGDDGQRCEHVGFNLALNKPMFVSRKWQFHISPDNPGGPSGWRARNIVGYIAGTPRIAGSLAITQFISFLAFVHSVVTLGVFLLCPLLVPLLTGSKRLGRLISSQHHSNKKRRRRGQTAASHEETLYKLV